MRPLTLVVSLSALCLGGYWALTSGWTPETRSMPVETRPEAPGPVPAAAVVTPPPGPSIPPAPAPAPEDVRPAVVLDLQTDGYVVEGDTPEAVLRSLVARGPSIDGDPFFGLTEASIDLRYDLVETPDACVVEDAQVMLALTITLPEWTPVAGANPTLAQDWGRFRRALAGHEARHRAIAETGAASLHRAIDGLRRASCDEAGAEARRRLERLEIEIAAAHQRYDVETGHGRTEGAIWPAARR